MGVGVGVGRDACVFSPRPRQQGGGRVVGVEWMCHKGLSAAPFPWCLSLSARPVKTQPQMSVSQSSQSF